MCPSCAAAAQVNDAALARHLERLEQVDDGHVLTSNPAKRVRPDVGDRFVAMFSCVRRARRRFTRAMSSRTKMGFVR